MNFLMKMIGIKQTKIISTNINVMNFESKNEPCFTINNHGSITYKNTYTEKDTPGVNNTIISIENINTTVNINIGEYNNNKFDYEICFNNCKY